MTMQIKVLPEDFGVQEVLCINPGKEEASFRVYLLEKTGMNSSDAVRAAAEKTGVPAGCIRWAGRKDRQAVTVQHLSVPSRYDLSCSGEGFSVRFAGYSTGPIEPSVLKGNRFSVLLRDMTAGEAERGESRLEEVSRIGFLNYFDDQRFGNVGEKGEFFAEMLLKRRFSLALRKYFSFCHPDAPREVRRRKMLLAERWGRWEEMVPLCPEPRLRAMLALLRERGEGAERAALKLVPGEEMGLFFSAYQSFLWNETMSRFMSGKEGEFFRIDVKTGPLVQFRRLPSLLLSRLSKESLPTVGPGMPPLAADVEPVLSRRLYERGVRLSKFRLKEVEQAYFSSFPRACIALPGDMEWKREEDSLFPGKTCLRVQFFLPRGSYATMLIKSMEGSAPGSVGIP